jgi:hypothetical protein
MRECNCRACGHRNANGCFLKKCRCCGAMQHQSLYEWLLSHGLPTGYQVLCMNCQWIKRFKGAEMNKPTNAYILYMKTGQIPEVVQRRVARAKHR